MLTMDGGGEEERKPKRVSRHRKLKISFSASLPRDVGGVIAEKSICAVVYSKHPFLDVRDSIREMIQVVGVWDWKEMEELVYSYLALNSPDIHSLISDAFLTLF